MARKILRAYIPVMARGYQTLTEREKETLRLLVNGHDAKSIARHQGLSVHTVHERLRDARRKMETSSSREAARQLREVETATPQLMVDKQIGDASPPPAVAPLHHRPDWFGGSRRTGLIAGGTIMSLALALYALTSLSGAASNASPEPAVAAAETEAVGTARQWLALVDARDWQGSWAATGDAFRQANSPERWSTAAQGAHGAMGAALSRQLVSADFSPAPPDGVWTVRFRTRFANQRETIETVALGYEGGAWRVVGLMLD